MIIDTIKLIASELADMSPKTQLEIVKLCKNMCLAVKDYLVENDETIEDINTYIENLQTAVSNLNGAIADLTAELSTAESNITANANAILVLQDAVATIQSALNNVYSKTEIDTLLSNIYTKSQVDTLLNAKANSSDVYTKSEVYNKSEVYAKDEVYSITETNALLNTKLNLADVCYYVVHNINDAIPVADFNILVNAKIGVILYDDKRYYLTIVGTSGSEHYYVFKTLNIENGIMYVLTVFDTNRLLLPAFETACQEILVSGTNIKTINGQSLLGSGDIQIGSGGGYLHIITACLYTSASDYVNAMFIIKNDSATP